MEGPEVAPVDVRETTRATPDDRRLIRCRGPDAGPRCPAQEAKSHSTSHHRRYHSSVYVTTSSRPQHVPANVNTFQEKKLCTAQLCAQRIYILAHTMDESIRVSDYFRMTGSQNSSGAGVVNCNCTGYMHVEEHCKMSLTSISLVSGEHVNYIQQVFQVTVHLTTPH